eukprot:gnl/TRDRNA2_/TRDRNA2_61613_c0_seq1.p1 gnl/TRDRNA2_/TRDRNA2_61613_c0~~gnl/TRDRNA2_/TRDRNA2_61613_c0_seq1.p1  ORF type:complete len:132 (+),score=1.67 gnl/TRDRNA2_/TRDRNA2_61613_c0_seq1:478-873(+)
MWLDLTMSCSSISCDGGKSQARRLPSCLPGPGICGFVNLPEGSYHSTNNSAHVLPLYGGICCQNISEWWQTCKRRAKCMRSAARTIGQAAYRLRQQAEKRPRAVQREERLRNRSSTERLSALNPHCKGVLF